METPDHETARACLKSAHEQSDLIRISCQVLQEYLAMVTRPQTWSVTIARADVLDDVERLATAGLLLLFGSNGQPVGGT